MEVKIAFRETFHFQQIGHFLMEQDFIYLPQFWTKLEQVAECRLQQLM